MTIKSISSHSERAELVNPLVARFPGQSRSPKPPIRPFDTQFESAAHRPHPAHRARHDDHDCRRAAASSVMTEYLVAVLEFECGFQSGGVSVDLQRASSSTTPSAAIRDAYLERAVNEILGCDSLTTRGGRSSAATVRPASISSDTRSDDARQVAHPHLGPGQAEQDRRVAECC